jgi:hypothetical protein
VPAQPAGRPAPPQPEIDRRVAGAPRIRPAKSYIVRGLRGVIVGKNIELGDAATLTWDPKDVSGRVLSVGTEREWPRTGPRVLLELEPQSVRFRGKTE